MGEPGAAVGWDAQLLRSLLFVPGSDERKLGRVASFGADVVVIDLEDAVAEDQKSAARALTREAIPGCGAGGALVTVRVNAVGTGRMEDDVAAVLRPELAAIMIPKVQDAATLQALDRALAAAEREQGMPDGSVRVLALIETARGIAGCERILASAPARTHTAVFGAGDFSAELGVDLTRDAEELLYARSRLVVAARAAGLAKPVDGPWLDLRDTDGLAADCVRSLGLGFQGRITVYPPQVETVHRAYSSLPVEEVERARRVVEAFEEAQARGVASIRVDGRFVDYPLYRLARERLMLADSFESGERR